MDIITKLGINNTALIQFIIFVITFVILKKNIFDVYTKALVEREARTRGGEEHAEELHKMATELHSHFETKAKDINSQIHSIFHEHQVEADKEYDKILTAAKEEASQLVEKTQKKITSEVQNLTISLKSEIPQIAELISTKVLKN